MVFRMSNRLRPYRTHKENLVMSMLTGNRDKIKARKRGQKPTNSRVVPLTIPFSNLFYKNLTDIYSLKELLYNEGLTDDKGLPLIKTETSNSLLLH